MKCVLANWKMNLSSNEVKLWFEKFSDLTTATNSTRQNLKTNVIIAPSFVHLALAHTYAVALAAQDVSVFDKGAHTGDIGIFQIKDFCNYCIVGHSERNESIQTIEQKISHCLANQITPIVCFVTTEQALKLKKEGVMFLWEDPANISTGGVFKPKDPAMIAQEIATIKAAIGKGAQILYGGSVNRTNIADLAQIPELDGVCAGSASLDPKHFYDLIMAYEIR